MTARRALPYPINLSYGFHRLVQFSVSVILYTLRKRNLVVRIVQQRRSHKHIRGGPVHGECDVIKSRQTRKCRHVILMSLNYKIITEENKHTYLLLCDKGAYLLISSQRAGKQFRDLPLERIFDSAVLFFDGQLLYDPTGSSCSI